MTMWTTCGARRRRPAAHAGHPLQSLIQATDKETAHLGFVDELLKCGQLHLSEDGVLNVCHVAHCLQEDGGGVEVLFQGVQGFGALFLLIDTHLDVLHQLLQVFQLADEHLWKRSCSHFNVLPTM